MRGPAILLLLGLSTAAVQAAVYRCEQNGKVTYTDQPCAGGSEPAQLPPITSVPTDHNAHGLARQYDADAKRQTESQAKADREWVKKHGDDKARDEVVRKGLIDGRVVKGMTPEQVRRVLNEPQNIEDQGGPKERWTYQNGRERRTIAFKEGVVFSDTSRSGRK